jgi:hypothetical protein
MKIGLGSSENFEIFISYKESHKAKAQITDRTILYLCPGRTTKGSKPKTNTKEYIIEIIIILKKWDKKRKLSLRSK